MIAKLHPHAIDRLTSGTRLMRKLESVVLTMAMGGSLMIAAMQFIVILSLAARRGRATPEL